jgi:hypothetical protein
MPSQWLNIGTDEFRRMRTVLTDVQRKQLPFATARALNDAAKIAAKQIDSDLPSIFAKATPFTRHAVVAPASLGARKDRLAAVVTVRDIQGKYLLHEQEGGTRTPAENTRKPASALVMPAPALKLNAYGNIPSGRLAQMRARAAASAKHATGTAFLSAGAPGLKGGIGGYFQRAKGKLIRLTGFQPSASYHAKFGFPDRVARAAAPAFAAAFRTRLAEALATARR